LLEIRAVAFDVAETLMSIEPIRSRLVERGYAAELYDLWLTRAVRDGLALAAAGGYVPFGDISENALRDVTDHSVDDATLEYVLRGWEELPAHSDVAPALEFLTASGVRVVALTTGSADSIDRFLAHNNLSQHFEAVISCEEIGAWKPAASAYNYAAYRLQLPPENVALVAAHAWDCHGAKRAGLKTGWVGRLEGHYGATFDAPDVAADNLEEVVRGLLSRTD
jgi:2-haloacid dehalogenase